MHTITHCAPIYIMKFRHIQKRGYYKQKNCETLTMGHSNYQTLWTLNIADVHRHQTFKHRHLLRESNINKHSKYQDSKCKH